MCGHVGMAGVLTPQDEKAFHNMLIMDSVRGVDSTGVAVIHRGEAGHHIAKGIGDPYRLMDRKSYDKSFIGFQRAIIGHNRYATQGAVNDRNAHPYEFTSLIGAHNGTLTNKWQLADARDFTVDSENLYHHIETKGLEDLMTIVLGAWALVWWDKEAETINLLRNKERTLFVSYSPDGKKMYWASEAWMLEGALSRNNLEFTKPMLLAEDRLYSTKVSKTGEMDKTHIRYMPSTGKPYQSVVTYPRAATTQTATGTTDYNRVQQQQAGFTSTGKLRVVPKTTEVKSEEALKHLSRSLNAGYAHSKGVVLEVLAEDTDDKGSRYLICFDENNPSYTIRFYCNQNIKTEDYIDQIITADINGLVMDTTGSYYKVAVHSVELVGVEVEDPVGDGEDENFTTYLGHKKQQLSYNDWVGAYGDCAWCSSNVLPTDKHILTTEGQCVCQHCATDSEVTGFIKVSVNAI